MLVADDLAELPFGLEHPGGGPPEHMSPLDQCSTLREVRRQISIIDSIGLVDGSVRQSFPLIPSR